MKTLMLTTAASALALGLAACSDAGVEERIAYTPEDPAEVEKTETADTDGDNTTDVADAEIDMDEMIVAHTLASNEFMLDELIGEEIYGANGDQIASVTDFVIGSDNTLETLVFANNGIAGVGTDYGQIPFPQVSFAFDTDGEPALRVDLTDEALEYAADWEQDGLNDYSLATEIMGTNADLAGGEKIARITDFVANTSGEVEYLVVADGLTGTVTDTRYLVDPERLVVEQGDGGLVLNISHANLKSMKTISALDD